MYLKELSSVAITVHLLFWNTVEKSLISKWQACVGCTVVSLHIDFLPAMDGGGGTARCISRCIINVKITALPQLHQMLWHAGVITAMIRRGNRSQSASHSSMTPVRLSATKPPRVIQPKAGVIADDNACRNGHACLLLFRSPYLNSNERTASSQDCGSIPGSPSPHVEMSLGKILNPKKCSCVWIGEHRNIVGRCE